MTAEDKSIESQIESKIKTAITENLYATEWIIELERDKLDKYGESKLKDIIGSKSVLSVNKSTYPVTITIRKEQITNTDYTSLIPTDAHLENTIAEFIKVSEAYIKKLESLKDSDIKYHKIDIINSMLETLKDESKTYTKRLKALELIITEGKISNIKKNMDILSKHTSSLLVELAKIAITLGAILVYRWIKNHQVTEGAKISHRFKKIIESLHLTDESSKDTTLNHSPSK